MLQNDIVNHLSSGGIVLVPTRRLASRLIDEFNQLCAKNAVVWRAPCVFSLEDWSLSLWQALEIEGKITKQLLTPQQSSWCFEEIVQAFSAESLLNISSTAKIGYSAWELLHHWLLLEDCYFTPENEEEEAFLLWVKQYQIWLNQHDLLDNAQLIKHLLPLLEAYPKQSLLLYGFEELTPRYERFFNQLQAWGWCVCSRDLLAVSSHQKYCFGFSERLEEYQSAALWAKTLLLSGKQKIAIVVPELAKTRDLIEAVFQEIFDPLSICNPNPQISPYFNISAAKTLSSYPLVEALFAILRLGLSHFSMQDYVLVLSSCFTRGYAKERYERLAHIQFLKTRLKDKLTLKSVIAWLEKSEERENLNEWISLLTELQKENLSARKRGESWSEKFARILEYFGWPGERPLNSIEHQIVKRVYKLFQEHTSFAQIIKIATYADAFSLLQKLANHTLFQPENKKATIQILGVLEAAGQTFDYLWVTGMHHEGWPSKAAPNPFLPLALQKEKNIPRASPEREFRYCLKVTQSLHNSAQEVIFSYPQMEEGHVLEQSALVLVAPSSWLEYAACWQIKTAQRLEKVHTEENVLEYIEDENTLPLQKISHFTSSGLALISACPFKAFASLRLEAKAEEWPEIWLKPQDRGIILHRILERFWHQFKDQKTLLSASLDELNRSVKALIDIAFKDFIHESASTLYLEAEKETLLNIMLNYLEAEKKRPSFRVLKTEANAQWRLGDYPFKLRFDRVDQTENNEVLLIDYKTGQFSLHDIWGERPKAPQLPLYFLAAQEAPQGLLAIKLSAKGCEYTGISAKELDIPGVQELHSLQQEVHLGFTWQDLSEYWQQQLQMLLDKFCQGDASLSPLEGNNTCQYCDYKPLCRVHERIT